MTETGTGGTGIGMLRTDPRGETGTATETGSALTVTGIAAKITAETATGTGSAKGIVTEAQSGCEMETAVRGMTAAHGIRAATASAARSGHAGPLRGTRAARASAVGLSGTESAAAPSAKTSATGVLFFSQSSGDSACV